MTGLNGRLEENGDNAVKRAFIYIETYIKWATRYLYKSEPLSVLAIYSNLFNYLMFKQCSAAGPCVYRYFCKDIIQSLGAAKTELLGSLEETNLFSPKRFFILLQKTKTNLGCLSTLVLFQTIDLFWMLNYLWTYSQCKTVTLKKWQQSCWNVLCLVGTC